MSAVSGESPVLGLGFQADRFRGQSVPQPVQGGELSVQVSELAGVQGAHLVKGGVKGGVAVLEAGHPGADLVELEADAQEQLDQPDALDVSRLKHPVVVVRPGRGEETEAIVMTKGADADTRGACKLSDPQRLHLPRLNPDACVRVKGSESTWSNDEDGQSSTNRGH